MPIKVLLIDDDQEFLDILSERLTIRDMDVTTMASAIMALDLVRKTSFDVIVLDLQMPEMDGLQALEQFTAIDPDLRIILLTGHATVSRGVQAMKLGAVDVIEKPADIRELVDKIKTVAAGRAGKSNARAGSPEKAAQPNGGVSGLLRSLRDVLKK